MATTGTGRRRKPTPLDPGEPEATASGADVSITDDNEIIADVRETQQTPTGTRELNYQAPVRTLINDDDNDREGYNPDEDQERDYYREDQRHTNPQPPAPPIPKTPLEDIFDYLTDLIKGGDVYDGFYAHLVRNPDYMSDRFNRPCREMMDLRAVQFSTKDRLNFIEAVQRANGNSGGRFTITIYNLDYTQLMRPNPTRRFEQIPLKVNVLITDPVREITPQQPGANNGASGDLAAALIRMAEMQQENTERILTALTQTHQFGEYRERPKSSLESIMERAMEANLTRMLSGEDRQQQNGFDHQRFMTDLMTSANVMSSMGQAFSKMIHHEPAPPPEKNFMDYVREASDIPVVQNVTNTVLGLAEAAAVKGLKLSDNPQANPQQQPQQEESNMNSEQQELLTDIIEALESDEPINGDNETLKELAADYPSEFEDLKAMCQAAPFTNALQLLLGRIGKIKPFPLMDFINIQATNESGRYVFNERGDKLISRLQELHTYLSTPDSGNAAPPLQV